MVWDLEGLIGDLLVVISCSGEKGCAVGEVVDAIQQKLASRPKPGPGTDNAVESSDNVGHDSQIGFKAVATIWQWLFSRHDLFLGPDRKYNSLTLAQVFAQSKSPRHADGAIAHDDPEANVAEASDQDLLLHCRDAIFPGDMRAEVLPETMWECLAGHSVDYVRLPKSEWDLLQGIASSGEKGILQGDLCRLTGQDKRSVPKRTDSLVRKGYITKRTVLVRGTKTSNLWLNRFVPSFLEKKEKKEHLSTAGMNLDHEFLRSNREGVPWHDRWTGDSVDYVAFATTIVEVVKAWGTIRLLDLKLKLNVTELPWQRKTATKAFRFMHTRGILQFVGAKLDNKLFKDCLRFLREMDDSDWEVYLAVGKKGPADETGSVFVHSDLDVDPALLASHPPWSPDEPLHTYVARTTRSMGGAHLSNTDYLSLTMSGSFTRFITTMVSAMAESTVQPPRLKHYQLRKEQVRNGKIMSFRYWVLPSISQAEEDQEASSRTYGFSALPAKSGMQADSADLTVICKPHRQALKGTRGVNRLDNMLRAESSVDQSETEASQQDQGPQQLMVTLKVSSEHLRRSLALAGGLQEPVPSLEPALAPEKPDTSELPMVVEPPVPTDTPQVAVSTVRSGTTESVPVEEESSTEIKPSEARYAHEGDAALLESAMTVKDTGGLTALPVVVPAAKPGAAPISGPDTRADGDPEAPGPSSGGRGRVGPGGRGGRASRGRGRKGARGGSMNSDGKPWKCFKCGGAWKNDIGLKYHLEKARVPCNPSFDPEAEPPKRGARKAQLAAELRASSPPRQPEPAEFDSESDISETHLPQDETKFLKDKRNGLASAIAESESTAKRQRPEPKAKKKSGCSKKVTTTRRFTPRPMTQTDSDTAFAVGRSALLPPMALQTTRSGSVAEVAPRRSAVGSPGRDSSAHIRSPSRNPLTPRKENGNVTGVVKREPNVSFEDLEYEKPTASPAGVPAARTLSQTALQRETKNRVKSMLLLLLANYGGHYPGGDSLWRTLRVLWNQQFLNDNCPTNRAFKGILAALTRHKVVHEHVHAFRARNGGFANVKIISMPAEDPFAPKAREVLARIKENYPDSYVPDEFKQAEPQALQVDGKLIRSKRVLPTELASLNAPVYAEDITGQQRLREIKTTESHNRRSSKRQKVVMELTEPEDGDDMFAMYQPKPARHTLADVQRMANFAQKTKLRFLEPNTALDDNDVRAMTVKPRTKTKKALKKSHLFDRYGLHQQSHIDVEKDPSESAKLVPPYIISSSKLGRWPDLDGQFFESCGGSFTLHPHDWFPNRDWFSWCSIEQAIDKTASAQASRGWFRFGETNSALRRFKDRLVAAARVEIAWADTFLSAMPGAAGPHNIFLNFWGTEVVDASQDVAITWPEDTQYGLQNRPTSEHASEASSEDSEFDDAVNVRLRGRKVYRRGGRKTKKYARRLKVSEPAKSVELKRRPMTAVPEDFAKPAKSSWAAWDTPAPSNPEELLAGIIVVRCLLGGIDRNIDWGFLAYLFPDLSLPVVRRFWLHARKMQRSYINELTRSFQQGYITACEAGELSLLDFDDPRAYDWDGLIKWTMQVPSKPDTQIPNSLDELEERFTLEDVASSSDDWRERFFHFQASAYTRLELSSADPGAVSIAPPRKQQKVDIDEVARSWIRALCCTGESDYQPEDIKAKLLTLADGQVTKVQDLLQKAIAQLTADKVVHSKRAGGVFDSKPYRLMEPYLSHLSRLAHWESYKQAAALKAQLDSAFRSGDAFSIPYVVSDGAMMALMNLNAHGRIVLKAVDLPYIPFGFTPGQYESRKLDKSLYHFGIEATPTAVYQFNEDIPTLAEVRLVAPPAEGPGGALPQWVDFFGKHDMNRWLEILGAVCFAYSTRGYVPIEALRQHLRPILEDFEAKLLTDWGKKTGVLEEGVSGSITVGEWWWLAVPIVKQHEHQPEYLF